MSLFSISLLGNSIKANISYIITLSWQDSSDTLKMDLIGQNGHLEEFNLLNGISEKISVPKDGRYYFISNHGRKGGTMKNVKYSFQKTEINVSDISTVKPSEVAADIKMPAVVNYTKIVHEDTSYKWPYIQHSITNNSNSNITGIEIDCLAYDKNGKPLELYWDAQNVAANGEVGSVGFSSNGVDYGIVTGIKSYSPKSYDWLFVFNYKKLFSNETNIYDGWPLFDGWWNQPNGVHTVNYILSCIKQVTYEDGTVWKNSEYDHWLETYKEKTISLQVLQSYYPNK